MIFHIIFCYDLNLWRRNLVQCHSTSLNKIGQKGKKMFQTSNLGRTDCLLQCTRKTGLNKPMWHTFLHFINLGRGWFTYRCTKSIIFCYFTIFSMEYVLFIIVNIFLEIGYRWNESKAFFQKVWISALAMVNCTIVGVKLFKICKLDVKWLIYILLYFNVFRYMYLQWDMFYDFYT